MTPLAIARSGAAGGRTVGGASARSAWLPPATLTLIMLGAWEGAVRLSGVTSLVMPPPSDVGAVMVSQAPVYLRHAVTTAAEVAAGLLFAASLGGLAGIAIVSSPRLGRALYPVLVSAQVIPKVAIAPLLMVWLGFDMAPKVALTALIAFFPVVINTIVGLNMTRQEGLHLFRSMGASPWQTFVKLRLPTSLPVLFAGLKVAATLSVIGSVVGEFSGGNAGLGYLLLMQVGRLDTAAAFGSVFYLTLMGLGFFALVAAVEWLLVPTHMLRRARDPGLQT
jgi:NitT/TauT family transport system permease protein